MSETFIVQSGKVVVAAFSKFELLTEWANHHINELGEYEYKRVCGGTEDSHQSEDISVKVLESL